MITQPDSEVKAVKGERLKLEIRNRCSFRGEHYIEDDWGLTAYGSSPDELVERMADKIVQKEERINPSSIYFTRVSVLVHDGQIFELETVADVSETDKEFVMGRIWEAVAINDKAEHLRKDAAAHEKAILDKCFREATELRQYNQLMGK